MALGALGSIVLTSLACAVELTLSGVIDPLAGFALIGGVHLLIGIGEAAIPVGVLSFLRQTRPDLIVPITRRSMAHEKA